jgi:gamma-glutamylcyclotransferase (GGCT)/AIG2-like uncharacterized protein YtfP
VAPLRRVFVYGTLKQGFRNFHVNRSRRLPGEFTTEQAFALYVIGEFGLPRLVHMPGRGQRVSAQVFEFDHAALAAMDLLERVDDAAWYTRTCDAHRIVRCSRTRRTLRLATLLAARLRRARMRGRGPLRL